jgi:hypothetical protein
VTLRCSFLAALVWVGGTLSTGQAFASDLGIELAARVGGGAPNLLHGPNPLAVGVGARGGVVWRDHFYLGAAVTAYLGETYPEQVTTGSCNFRPSSRGNRLWSGRAVLAGLLLGRVVTFTLGCGGPPPPAPGAEGGQCRGDACNPYCDQGLVCSGDNTCVPGGVSTGPPPRGCSPASPEPCVQGQLAQTCVGGATPYDELPDLSGCSVTATGAVGNATYCCTPIDAGDGG